MPAYGSLLKVHLCFILRKLDILGTGEMVLVKSTGFSSGGPSSVPSTQSHGSSQPSVMASDALLCHAGIHANRVLIYVSK